MKSYKCQEKPDHCPRCGSKRVVDIIYGMPGMELVAQEEAGLVVLGGCCPDVEADWQCLKCQAQMYDPRRER